MLEVQAVSRVVWDPKILPVRAESEVSTINSQNAQFKHQVASTPGVPAEPPSPSTDAPGILDTPSMLGVSSIFCTPSTESISEY